MKVEYLLTEFFVFFYRIAGLFTVLSQISNYKQYTKLKFTLLTKKPD
jgi:hypothetical protein